MSMFSPTSGAGSAPELIPNGTLAWALVTVSGAKQSKTSGGTYYPVTLTIIGGEYEGRKVFDMIPDVQDDRNGEKWRKMGITSITRIFEYTKGLPRRINQLCHTALMAGLIDQKSTLDESTIRKAIADIEHD